MLTAAPVAPATNVGGPGPGTPEAAAKQQAADMAKYFPDTKVDSNGRALIVTSGASRTEYANNVTNLNTATSNLGASSDPSVVNYLNKSGMPSDYNSRAAMAKQYGIEGYTGSAEQNTKLLGILQNGGKTDTTTTTVTDTGDKGKGAGAGDGGTGSGATGSTDVDDPNTPSGKIAKNLKDQYASSLLELDNQITNAKTNLASALSTLQNNPAATSAVNMIMQKYDQQIELMKNKNKILLGSDVKNLARTGMMQYANEMATNFMSEEQDKASKRVADLISTEMSMVLKAQESYRKGDLAAFSTASKALDAATKNKISAIDKLLNETDKAIKTQQNEAKAKAAADKQKITDDIRISTSISKTVADAIKTSGIKDQTKIDAYIDAMATKSGISNPDMLRSAVVKATQEADKLDLSAKNINSTINKRNKSPSPKTAGGGTDGSFKYSADDISQYANFFNQGGQAPDGTKYNARGSDGFVDPGAYTAAYTDWIKNGGTPQGFQKKFPVTNVNPESYSKLPKALQPAAKKTAQPPL